MAFAGALGLRIELSAVPRPAGLNDDFVLLFAESPTRFLAEVRPGDALAFEAALAGLPCARLGAIAADSVLAIAGTSGGEALRAGIADLKAAWQSTRVV
jgi:phosphoribosylformylglycinamidine synthase